jgi:hypothetical protein
MEEIDKLKKKIKQKNITILILTIYVALSIIITLYNSFLLDKACGNLFSTSL